jgi:hypothetical protein
MNTLLAGEALGQENNVLQIKKMTYASPARRVFM